MAVALNHFTTLEGGGSECRATVHAWPKWVRAVRGDRRSPFVLGDDRLVMMPDGSLRVVNAVYDYHIQPSGLLRYAHAGYERRALPVRMLLGQGRFSPIVRTLRKPTFVQVGLREWLMTGLEDGVEMRLKSWADGLSFEAELELTPEMRAAEYVRIEFDETETGKRVGMRLNHGYVRHEQFSDTLADEQDARALLRIAEIQERSAGKYAIGAQIADIAGWPDGRIVLNDTEVTYQQGISGYTGCDDTWVSRVGSAVAYNYGADTKLRIGKYNNFSWGWTFFRWSLAALAGGTCTAASLFLYGPGAGGADALTRVYEIAAANTDWVMGTANGSAQNGSSCGSYKITDTDDWAGATTFGVAGTDYVNTALAQETFDADGSGWLEFDMNAAGIAVVNGDMGGSTNLAAYCAVNESGTYEDVYSGKYTTDTSLRPKLTITYTAGGGPAAAYRTYIDQAMQRNRA
jgi:hypothetical protein